MTDAEIAAWFRPALPADDRAVLLDLAGRVDAALRQLGFDYVLYGGALLGHCVSNALLPWDDDIDLLVLDAVHPADLADRLAAALPELCVCPHQPRLLKVCHRAPSGAPWSVPFVDIGFMYSWGPMWCHDSVWGGTDAFPRADVTPTTRGRLSGVEVNVPARPAHVCHRKYGPDCLTSAVPPAFDHATEKPTGFPRVRVPLDRITRVLRGEHTTGPSALAPGLPPTAVPTRVGPPGQCVVLVPSGKVSDRRFEEALAELSRRGYPIRRVRQDGAPPGFRDRLATDALAEGFSELLWLDPAIAFDPTDVERLRVHDVPFVCGTYPASGWAALACEFFPGTGRVRFGTGGGPIPVLSCGLGFALVRRAVFEAIAQLVGAGAELTYFTAPSAKADSAARVAEDVAFCRRAQRAGFDVVVDTSVRLWRTGVTRLGWEDAGGERQRHADFTLRVRAEPDRPEPPARSAQTTGEHPGPARNPLRGAVAPLQAPFPRVRLFVPTYQANAESLALTIESIRDSDWSEEPIVVTQPADWPVGRESGSRTYKRVLEAAAADGCDFALVLEDDVRVCRHLQRNLLTNPLVRRDQCDYLGLFIPDLIADPWERCETHLGYRLARPRYAAPNRLWERNRVWGSQALLLSRRLVLAALERWDQLLEGQDTRILSVCVEFRLPLWYTAPCLVEHAPLRSAFGTPEARAPDFDPDFRFEVSAGFQPPEDVPGWLTRAEGELLWRTALGRDVLELGTASGRSTACLAQSARRVVSVDVADQTEAGEWVRRYESAARVEFHRGDVAAVCGTLKGPFDVVFIDTLHDAKSVSRDIATALPLLAPNGLLAFHDYPDPGWPDVRRVVDEHARRLGWTRLAQADFLGVFRT
jgi:hypothetical protein